MHIKKTGLIVSRSHRTNNNKNQKKKQRQKEDEMRENIQPYLIPNNVNYSLGQQPVNEKIKTEGNKKKVLISPFLFDYGYLFYSYK